jgi:hypothetical protein
MRAPMPNHLSARFAAAAAIALSALACGGETPTEPAPVYEQKTETYIGTLNTGGGAAFDFTVTNPGNIVAKITELSPVSTLTMGLSLGYWDATTSSCSQDIRESVTLNTTLSGSPPGPAQYCVGVYDVGNVQAPTTFTIVVTHY